MTDIVTQGGEGGGVELRLRTVAEAARLALADVEAQLDLPRGVTLTATGLRGLERWPTRDVEDALQLTAQVLGALDRAALQAEAAQWVLADLAAWAVERWGGYEDVVAASGASYQTVANACYVGRHVPPEVRVPPAEGLTFSHHAEVAAVEGAEEQRAWLEKARAGGWGTRRLRAEIQAGRDAESGLDPVEEAVRRGLGRAVDGVARLAPERWADVLVDGVVLPLGRREVPAAAWRAVLERLIERLREEMGKWD